MELTKTIPSLEYARETVLEDNKGNADFTTPLRNLFMQDDGKITFENRADATSESANAHAVGRYIEFDLTEWAGNQMFNKLGMPAKYFTKTLRDLQRPDLVAAHFNTWIGTVPDKNVLLRTKITDDINFIKGILSDKYSILDNSQILESVETAIRGMESNYEIVDFHLDDHRMNLRLTRKDLRTSVIPLDALSVGVDIINSEVGASAAAITALVWRLVCSNGLRRLEQTARIMHQRHIGIAADKFIENVGNSIDTGLDDSKQLLEDFSETLKIDISNPYTTISNIAKARDRVSVKMAKTVMESWEEEEGNTAYNIINAFTRAARTFHNERRLEAERVAGSLVYLDPTQWATLDIPEEVDNQ